MVGISSYLLINFWYTRLQANKSAIKALTINRVGDMFLTIGLFTCFWALGNLDFSTVFSLTPYINETLVAIITISFLLAAMGKSAQIGLHTWLPDAMEGKIATHFISILCVTLTMVYIYTLFYSHPYLDHTLVNNSTLFNSLRLAILNPLVGDMVGDGFIGYSYKVNKGILLPNRNPRLGFTFSKDNLPYLVHLKENIYKDILTKNSKIGEWPNFSKTGKPATQYALQTRSIVELKELHNL